MRIREAQLQYVRCEDPRDVDESGDDSDDSGDTEEFESCDDRPALDTVKYGRHKARRISVLNQLAVAAYESGAFELAHDHWRESAMLAETELTERWSATDRLHAECAALASQRDDARGCLKAYTAQMVAAKGRIIHSPDEDHAALKASRDDALQRLREAERAIVMPSMRNAELATALKEMQVTEAALAKDKDECVNKLHAALREEQDRNERLQHVQVRLHTVENALEEKLHEVAASRNSLRTKLAHAEQDAEAARGICMHECVRSVAAELVEERTSAKHAKEEYLAVCAERSSALEDSRVLKNQLRTALSSNFEFGNNVQHGDLDSDETDGFDPHRDCHPREVAPFQFLSKETASRPERGSPHVPHSVVENQLRAANPALAQVVSADYLEAEMTAIRESYHRSLEETFLELQQKSASEAVANQKVIHLHAEVVEECNLRHETRRLCDASEEARRSLQIQLMKSVTDKNALQERLALVTGQLQANERAHAAEASKRVQEFENAQHGLRSALTKQAQEVRTNVQKVRRLRSQLAEESGLRRTAERQYEAMLSLEMDFEAEVRMTKKLVSEREEEYTLLSKVQHLTAEHLQESEHTVASLEARVASFAKEKCMKDEFRATCKNRLGQRLNVLTTHGGCNDCGKNDHETRLQPEMAEKNHPELLLNDPDAFPGVSAGPLRKTVIASVQEELKHFRNQHYHSLEHVQHVRERESRTTRVENMLTPVMETPQAVRILDTFDHEGINDVHDGDAHPSTYGVKNELAKMSGDVAKDGDAHPSSYGIRNELAKMSIDDAKNTEHVLKRFRHSEVHDIMDLHAESIKRNFDLDHGKLLQATTTCEQTLIDMERSIQGTEVRLRTGVADIETGLNEVAAAAVTVMDEFQLGEKRATLAELNINCVPGLRSIDHLLELIVSLMAWRADVRITVCLLWSICHSMYLIHVCYSHFAAR